MKLGFSFNEDRMILKPAFNEQSFCAGKIIAKELCFVSIASYGNDLTSEFFIT